MQSMLKLETWCSCSQVKARKLGNKLKEAAATTAVKPVATTAYKKKQKKQKETKLSKTSPKLKKIARTSYLQAEVTNVSLTNSQENQTDAENKALIEAIANNKEVIAGS